MKKVLAALVLFLSVAIPAFSNIDAINGDNLPLDNEEFKQKSDLFLENYDLTCSYNPVWNHEKPREQVIEELKDFNNYIESLKKANYDVKLLRLISMRCLYNLDEITSDEVKAYADQLKKKFKKDYRTWWIYGNYLATTTLIAESYDEFKTALEISEGYITRAFLNDYVYACLISGNVKHGWLALNRLAEIDEIPVEEEYFYSLYSNRLIFPETDGVYENTQVWKIKPRGDETYDVFSTLTGISVPVNGDWGLNYFKYENRQTAITVAPDKFVSKDKAEIGVTVLLLASSSENAYESYKDICIRRYTEPVKTSKKTINGIEFDVLEGEDLNAYADVRGGQRGIYLIAQIPYNEKSGLGLESSDSFSFDSSENTDGPRYFAAKPVLDRVPETVTVLLMLDTCNAVYKDSSKWFWDFANNCKFE